ncbi:MAG: LysR family transcriptional regulator [Atopobiaceae bacterium]|jgi:DNA-binding transcriptional LysR family regulator
MTLRQLRYLIAVAERGSINAAAQDLYTTQSNLSTSIHELESELGITIFVRTNRGVTLTAEGTELLGYARQVIEQVDMLETHYHDNGTNALRLSVSTQHYAFSVQAFIRLLESCDAQKYDLTMRETSTGQIISDVASFRSEIGILYLDSYNSHVLTKAFEDARLHFEPLFEAPVHVFVGESHPLAKKKLIEPEDLENLPRYSFEQGRENSFYYSEEPLSYLPHARNIRISDRSTLTNLLVHHRGYTLSTGVLTLEMQQGIVSVPLNTTKTMSVGYLIHRERKPSDLLLQYIDELKRCIRKNPTIKPAS